MGDFIVYYKFLKGRDLYKGRLSVINICNFYFFVVLKFNILVELVFYKNWGINKSFIY